MEMKLLLNISVLVINMHLNCIRTNTATHPITTMLKSNKFQTLRRYAAGCNRKPYAMIFMTHSAVKITRKMYSMLSCGRPAQRQ